MKFTRYLFIPTLVVIVYWLFGIPVLIFPKSEFFTSNLYSNLITGAALLLVSVFVLWRFVGLVMQKEYKNALVMLAGIPLAFAIGFLSIIVLLGFSGV